MLLRKTFWVDVFKEIGAIGKILYIKPDFCILYGGVQSVSKQQYNKWLSVVSTVARRCVRAERKHHSISLRLVCSLV